MRFPWSPTRLHARQHTPLVSVVIPAYNAADTIGGAISSVLTQNYPKIETIVVDDGSTDTTGEVLRGYEHLVQVISKPNGGVSSARNAGAARATGELIAFVDSDDIPLPAYIESLVDAYQRHEGGKRAVASNSYFMRFDGINPFRVTQSARFPTPDEQRLRILQANFASGWMMFSAQDYRDLGGCDESLRAVEDWDLWIRAIFSGITAVLQPAPQALYRVRPGSISSDDVTMLAHEQTVLRRMLNEERWQLRPEERAYLERRLAAGSPRELRFKGDAALKVGDTSEARRLYSEAYALNPHDLKLRLRVASMRAPGTAQIWRRRAQRDEEVSRSGKAKR